MSEYHKKVAVVLLSSRRERDLVLDCLASLRKTNYPKELLHIILVDNASEDDVIRVVADKFPEVRILSNKTNIGFAAGNNVGIFYALRKGSDYIMILNNDTVLDPLWLIELVRVFEIDPRIGCVCPKIYLYDLPHHINTDGNVIHFLGFGYCGDYKKKDEETDTAPHPVVYPSGAAMLLKRETIETLGGFEEKLFIYHDDLEYGWRMNLAGYQTWIAPKSKIWHKYRFQKPSNRKFYLLERNRFIVLFENYKILTLLLILPASIVMEVGIYFYALSQGWLLSKIRADLYFLNPKNLLHIWRDRGKKQLLRKVPEREIVQNFVGMIESEAIDHPLLRLVANPFFEWYWRLARRIIFW